MMNTGRHFLQNLKHQSPILKNDVRWRFYYYHVMQTESKSQNKIKYKTRLIGRRDKSYVPILVREVALIQLEDGSAVALDARGNRYFLTESLTELGEQLDPSHFFRANRTSIIQLRFIVEFHVHEKTQIALSLRPAGAAQIYISQERAPHFRKWIHEQ